MISPEFVLFDALKDTLIEKYPDATVTSGYNATPATFPCIQVEESDNYVYSKMSTVKRENAVRLQYTVNVYTNTVGTAKIEAKKIMADVDSFMESNGFTRTLCEPIPNLANATIYRLYSEYDAACSYDSENETYHIYST